ncbi:uncharacterized protein LOC108864594, partial [Galendromus occidentalis]|uniref:Uncharacterized protein LOC108864594 n=1 Tax=Galendromus occidentalis TaxID=34638 RepID=A0AAJ7L738_9ACAR
MAPPVRHSPPCTRATSAAKRTTGQQVDETLVQLVNVNPDNHQNQDQATNPGEETNEVTFSERPKQGSQEKTAAAINVDQEEPPKFNGRSDPIDWLREFKRVASFNGHTKTQMLANAPFWLVGEALDWFDNEDDQVDQWETFETKFRDRFVDTTKISEEAREKLKRLIYERGTSFTGHLESVLKLCRKLDSRLSEDETIRKVIQTFPRDQAMTL